MEERRAIICGGRDFSAYDSRWFNCGMGGKLRELLQTENITEEVCGMADGADLYGREIAERMHLKITEFPADWNMNKPEFEHDPKKIKYNKYNFAYNSLAGINRNRRMAEYVKGRGICIALPGGSGTKNMIKQAKKNDIPVYKWSIEQKEFVKL